MGKKYKLIKEYPNSPKLGSIIVDTNPNNGATDCWFSDNWGKPGSTAFFIPRSTNPEKHPEFWEEIVEKEWEIIDYKAIPGSSSRYVGLIVDPSNAINTSDVQWGINSVKRLSDGELFTVGDAVEFYDRKTNIKAIYYNKHGQLLFRFYGISTPLTGVSSSQIHLKKIKQPLFKTEDGVDVFEDSEIFCCKKADKMFPLKIKGSIWLNNKDLRDKFKYFSTLDACKSYINKNTVILKTDDGVDLRLGDEFWHVDPNYFVNWGKISDGEFRLLNGYKHFSTKEAARKYVDLNKPMYSLKDIFNAKSGESKFPNHFCINFDKLKK